MIESLKQLMSFFLSRLETLGLWLIPDAREGNSTNETLRRRIFISAQCLVAAPIMVWLASFEIPDGDFTLVLLLLVGAILSTGLYLLVRAGYSVMIPLRVTLLYICAAIAYQLLLDRNSLQLVYPVLIPLISIFIFGAAEGIIWSVVYFFLILIIINPTLGFDLPNIVDGKIDFIGSYIVVFTFALLHEILHAQVLTVSKRRNDELGKERVRLLESQQELQGSENRFRHLAELASDWFYETNADLDITYLSPRYEELTGTPVKIMVGRNLLDLVDRFEDCDKQTLKESLRKHEAFPDFYFRFSGAKGKQLYALSRGEPTYDDSGNFQGYFGTATDMTTYQRFQEEIRSKDRTLQHVQKLDAIGQLTSGVAHDFNNLLTVIKGNIEFIRMKEISKEEKEAIDAIDTSASQAAELTSKLLTFSRQQPLTADSINLAQTLPEFTELIRRSIGESIELEVIAAPDLHNCKADKTQLETALLNLALNGRDAMDGKGKLTITARNETIEHDAALQAGSYIRISVIDEGRGMPASIIDKVTEPFFTTKPLGKGTGLGLSMVFGFVTQSGGKLELDSSEGIGTRVSLILPMSEVLQTAKKAHAESIQNNIGIGKQVLMVEDETNVQKIVGRMLTMLGCDTTICGTGEEALEAMKDLVPDLIITDMMLGTGISGLELADRVRASHPDTCIILMSGYPEEYLAERKDNDFDYELLRKPFGYQDLLESLERNLTS